MKKFLIVIILAIIATIMFFIFKNNNKKETSNNTMLESGNILESNEIANNSIDENKIYIKVNNQILEVELEENSATKELIERLKSEDIVTKAHEYGGFEKVCDLGFSLPKEDTNITTEAGDIVLYQGNQISLFYNSNSWSYTKLGKIKNASSKELKNILGNGDITLTFTLSK